MAYVGKVLNLTIKWSGKEYKITDLPIESTTVGDLKQIIKDQTGVLPERQKLLGLNLKGKPAADDVTLSLIRLKPNAKIMMMGTREEKLEEMISPAADVVNNEVVNDLDIEEEEILIENRHEYLAKVEKRVSSYEIKMINQPRPGKKLLVLDVDYTLFDHRSVAENVEELMRPYLHEFLTAAYVDYDIAIWSATSMKWVEVKMKEFGALNNENYKIMFLLDSAAMITVHTPKYGVIETKPLGVIWGKFKEYTNQNTIMFDDLRRNFIMNPQNGLKIRPFREAFKNKATDEELLRLSKYLKDISRLDDISSLDHRRWERYKKS